MASPVNLLPIGTVVYPLYSDGTTVKWRHTNQELTKEVIIHTMMTPPNYLLSQFDHAHRWCMYVFPTPIDDKKLDNRYGKVIGFIFLEAALHYEYVK